MAPKSPGDSKSAQGCVKYVAQGVEAAPTTGAPAGDGLADG